LHDRILAPIYPFAFVLIAFAFLGAPRTTRQSPAWSVTGVILAVTLLRMVGFASTVFALKFPIAVLFQYLAVAATMGASLFAISRGLIIEPPAAMTKAIDAAREWLLRRAGAVARPTQ
jgi:lipopolysaccharide export system permease protein